MKSILLPFIFVLITLPSTAAAFSSENFLIDALTIGGGAVASASGEEFSVTYAAGTEGTISEPVEEISTPTPSGGTGGGGGGGISTPVPVSIYAFNVPLTLLPIQSGTLTQNFSDGKKVFLEVSKGSVSTTTTFTISEENITGYIIGKDAEATILIGDSVISIIAADESGNPVTSLGKALVITVTDPDLSNYISNRGVYVLDTLLREWILIPEATINENRARFSIHNPATVALLVAPRLPATLPAAFPAYSADTDNNKRVDIFDFNILMVYWGSDDARADFNADGSVDIFDFNILMIQWTG